MIPLSDCFNKVNKQKRLRLAFDRIYIPCLSIYQTQVNCMPNWCFRCYLQSGNNIASNRVRLPLQSSFACKTHHKHVVKALHRNWLYLPPNITVSPNYLVSDLRVILLPNSSTHLTQKSGRQPNCLPSLKPSPLPCKGISRHQIHVLLGFSYHELIRSVCWENNVLKQSTQASTLVYNK